MRKVDLLLSVIIVTYNAEKSIIDTLDSLYIQTMREYEVIFVDGGSNDGTKEILCNFEKCFINIGVAVQMLSENDKGIYDAMNKGIRLANGKYGYFLNAGDVLYSETIFSKVAKELDDLSDVVYGDVIDDYGYKRELLKARKIDAIRYSMPFCHQAVFTRTDILKQYLYNITYNLCADYDMYLRMYLKKQRFKHLDEIVAIYSRAGVSSNNTVEVLRQYKIVQKEHKIFSVCQAWWYYYRVTIHLLREIKHRIWRR